MFFCSLLLSSSFFRLWVCCSSSFDSQWMHEQHMFSVQCMIVWMKESVRRIMELMCVFLQVGILRMSVGFIGAGQLAHALVKGFTAAGEKHHQTQIMNFSLSTDRIVLSFYLFYMQQPGHSDHICQDPKITSFCFYILFD